MATVPVTRVRAGATRGATLVTLLVTAGLGNQALESWRIARAGGKGHGGWTGVLFQPLLLTGWRFTEQGGANALDHFLAPLVFNVVFVVGTALLVAFTTRGGGRLATLVATWSVVTFVGGAAAAASTPLAFAGIAGEASQAFRSVVPDGLSLGFVVGFIAAVVAALFAGRGGGAAGAAESLPPHSSLESTAILPTGLNWPLGDD